MNRESRIDRSIEQMVSFYSKFGENVTQPEAMIPVLDVRERLDLSLDGLRVASAFAHRESELAEERQVAINRAIRHRDLIGKREERLSVILTRTSQDPLAVKFAQTIRDQIDQLQTLQQTDPQLQRGFSMLAITEAPAAEEVTEPKFREDGVAKPVRVGEGSGMKIKSENNIREVSLIHNEGVMLTEFEIAGKVYIYLLDKNAAKNPVTIDQICEDLEKNKKAIYNAIGRVNIKIAHAGQRIVNKGQDGKKAYYLKFTDEPDSPEEPAPPEDKLEAPKAPAPTLPKLTIDEAANFFGLDLGLIKAIDEIVIKEIDEVIVERPASDISQLHLKNQEDQTALRGIVRSEHRIKIPKELEDAYNSTASLGNEEAKKKASVVIPVTEVFWISQFFKPEAQELIARTFNTKGFRQLDKIIRKYLPNQSDVSSSAVEGKLAGLIFEQLAYVCLRSRLDENQILLDPEETFRLIASYYPKNALQTDPILPFQRFLPGISIPDGILLTDCGEYLRMDVTEYKVQNTIDLDRQVRIYKQPDLMRNTFMIGYNEKVSSVLGLCLRGIRPRLGGKPVMVPVQPNVIFVTSEKEEQAKTDEMKEQLEDRIPDINRIETVPVTAFEFGRLLRAHLRDTYQAGVPLVINSCA